MSYIDAGVTGSAVAHDAASPDDTGLVASRDIIRRNAIGQTVVVVPAGQPIPAGLKWEPGEATPAPPRAGQAQRDRPRPKPFLTGPERQNLFSERALSLLRRRP
jgi:hypothetical protein